MTIFGLGTGRLSALAPTTTDPPPGLPGNGSYSLGQAEQVFPQSALAWLAAFPQGETSSIPVQAAIDDFTEAAQTVRNAIEPAASDQALSAVGSPLFRRRADGLRAAGYDGKIVAHPIRGVELCVGDEQLYATSALAAWLGPEAVNFAVLLLFQVDRPPSGFDRAMLGKGEPQDETAGYLLGLDDAGRLTFQSRDADSQGTYETTTTGRVDDGAWRCALAVIQHLPVIGTDTTFLRLFTESEDCTPYQVDANRSFANAASAFRFGACGSWSAAGLGQTVVHLWGAQLQRRTTIGSYVPACGLPTECAAARLSFDQIPGYLASFDRGWLSMKVVFPYAVDEAQGRTLCRIQGEYQPSFTVDIHLWRDLYEALPGRIHLKICFATPQSRQDVPWQLVSQQQTGLPIGRTAEDAAEDSILVGWNFPNRIVRMQLNGVLAALIQAPASGFSGFSSTSVRLGDGGVEGTQLGAPMYDVRIRNEGVTP